LRYRLHHVDDGYIKKKRRSWSSEKILLQLATPCNRTTGRKEEGEL